MLESLPQIDFSLKDKITPEKVETVRNALSESMEYSKENLLDSEGAKDSFNIHTGESNVLAEKLLSEPDPITLWQVAWTYNAQNHIGLMSRLKPEDRQWLLDLVDEEAGKIWENVEAMEASCRDDQGQFQPGEMKVDAFKIMMGLISTLRREELIPSPTIDGNALEFDKGLGSLDEKAMLERLNNVLDDEELKTGEVNGWVENVGYDSNLFVKILSLEDHPSIFWAALVRNQADPWLVMERLTSKAREKLVDLICKVIDEKWGENETNRILEMDGYRDGRFDPRKLGFNPFLLGKAVIEELYEQGLIPRPEEIVGGETEKTGESQEGKERFEVGDHGVLLTKLIINGPVDEEGKDMRTGELQMREVSSKAGQQYVADFAENLFKVEKDKPDLVEFRQRKAAFLQLLGLSYLFNNNESMRHFEGICKQNNFFGAKSFDQVFESLEHIRGLVESKQAEVIEGDGGQAREYNTILSNMLKFTVKRSVKKEDVFNIKKQIIDSVSSGTRAIDMMQLGLLLRDFDQVTGIRGEYGLNSIIQMLSR